MSRSKQVGKQFKEWWGKRPLSGHRVSNNSGTDKFFKRLLHKMERQQSKKQIRKDINDSF